jgi:hypothetical protein
MSENNSWLGREILFQTFDNNVELKIDEIRQLLDLSEDVGLRVESKVSGNDIFEESFRTGV